MSDEFQERLARLQELLDGKLITSEEFEDRRRRLLDNYLGAPGGSPEEPAPAKDPFATSEGDGYSPRRATRLADLMPGLEIGPNDNRFRLVREIGGWLRSRGGGE